MLSYKTHEYLASIKKENKKETTFYNSKRSLGFACGEKTKAIMKEIM